MNSAQKSFLTVLLESKYLYFVIKVDVPKNGILYVLSMSLVATMICLLDSLLFETNVQASKTKRTTALNYSFEIKLSSSLKLKAVAIFFITCYSSIIQSVEIYTNVYLKLL